MPRDTRSLSPPFDALDAAKLQELRNLGNEMGRDYLVKLFALFADGAWTHLHEIKRASGAAEARAAEEAAHLLRGSSATVAALTLSAMAAELEALARENALDTVSEIVDNLEGELRRVVLALNSVLGAPL